MASEATGGGNASDGEPILSPNQVDLTCKVEGVVLKYLGRLKVHRSSVRRNWRQKMDFGLTCVWKDIGG